MIRLPPVPGQALIAAGLGTLAGLAWRALIGCRPRRPGVIDIPPEMTLPVGSREPELRGADLLGGLTSRELLWYKLCGFRVEPGDDPDIRLEEDCEVPRLVIPEGFFRLERAEGLRQLKTKLNEVMLRCEPSSTPRR